MTNSNHNNHPSPKISLVEMLQKQFAGRLVIYELSINDDMKQELKRFAEDNANAETSKNYKKYAEANPGVVFMTDQGMADEQEKYITIITYDTSHIEPELIHDPCTEIPIIILKMAIDRLQGAANEVKRIKKAKDELAYYYDIIIKNNLLVDINMHPSKIEQDKKSEVTDKSIIDKTTSANKKMKALEQLDEEGKLVILRQGIPMPAASKKNNKHKNNYLPSLLETITKPYEGIIKVKFIEIDAIQSRIDEGMDVAKKSPRKLDYATYQLENHEAVCITDDGTRDKIEGYTRIIIWNKDDIDTKKINDPFEEQQILVLYSTVKEGDKEAETARIITAEKNKLTFYYDLLSKSDLKKQLISAEEMKKPSGTEALIKEFIAKLHEDDDNVKSTLEILVGLKDLAIMPDEEIKGILPEAFNGMIGAKLKECRSSNRKHTQECRELCNICEEENKCSEKISFVDVDKTLEAVEYNIACDIASEISENGSKEAVDVTTGNATEEKSNIKYNTQSIQIGDGEYEIKKIIMYPNDEPSYPSMIKHYKDIKTTGRQGAILQLLGIQQKLYEGDIEVKIIKVKDDIDDKDIPENYYEDLFQDNPEYLSLTDYSITDNRSSYCRVIACDMKDVLKHRAERPWENITINVYCLDISNTEDVSHRRKNIKQAKNKLTYYFSKEGNSEWLTESDKAFDPREYINTIIEHPKIRKLIIGDLHEKEVLKFDFKEKQQQIIHDIVEKKELAFQERDNEIGKDIKKQCLANAEKAKSALIEREIENSVLLKKNAKEEQNTAADSELIDATYFEDLDIPTIKKSNAEREKQNNYGLLTEIDVDEEDEEEVKINKKAYFFYSVCFLLIGIVKWSFRFFVCLPFKYVIHPLYDLFISHPWYSLAGILFLLLHLLFLYP